MEILPLFRKTRAVNETRCAILSFPSPPHRRGSIRRPLLQNVQFGGIIFLLVVRLC